MGIKQLGMGKPEGEPVEPGGVLPISHNALDRILYVIFLPFCQVIQLSF